MSRTTVFSWFRFPVFSEKVHSYGQTKRDFYESRIYLRNVNKLASTFNLNQLDGLATEKTVSFYGIRFGYSLKDTILKLGKPNYRTSESKLFKDHKIIFYRLKISTVNCILQLHFKDGLFFLGIIEMRTGDKHLKERLFDLIHQKYGIKEKQISKPIRDIHGNQIIIKEDVVPYVVYTTGNRQMREGILSTISKIKEHPEKIRSGNQSILLDMI